MKKLFNIINASAMIAVAICSSCSKEYIFQGPADLTVINVTTGDTLRRITTVDFVSAGDSIVFNPGNTMKLLFTPPTNYMSDRFDVTYDVFNTSYQVSCSPYEYSLVVPDTVTSGEYTIRCSAMSEKWSDQSYCIQAVSILVK